MRIADRTLVFALALVAAGCATSSGPRGRATVGPALLAESPLGGVELEGSARGPIPGFGPAVDVHAFLRADGALRAEFRAQDDEGRPIHEVLVWTPEVALLFDRVEGRFTELGDAPGSLEVFDRAFVVEEAIWLMTGRRTHGDRAAWTRADDEIRARALDRGRRAPAAATPAWTELVWRESDGVGTMRSEVEAFEGGGADALPQRLRVVSSRLEAPIVVDWSSVRRFAARGDSILDPLWNP